MFGISAGGAQPLAPPTITSRRKHTPITTQHTTHASHGAEAPEPASTNTQREGFSPKRKKNTKTTGTGSPPKKAKLRPVLERVRWPLAPLLEELRPFSSLDIPTNPELLDIKYDKDKLGTLVQSLSTKLATSSSWESFATQARGRAHLAEGIHLLDHPAAPLLARFRDHGVPVVLSDEAW